MTTSHFDSIYMSGTLSYIDSLQVNQAKIVESLRALNSTTVKLLNQHKFLDKVSYDTVFTVFITIAIFLQGTYLTAL
jgi:hypothetical protein